MECLCIKKDHFGLYIDSNKYKGKYPNYENKIRRTFIKKYYHILKEKIMI